LGECGHTGLESREKGASIVELREGEGGSESEERGERQPVEEEKKSPAKTFWGGGK